MSFHRPTSVTSGGPLHISLECRRRSSGSRSNLLQAIESRQQQQQQQLASIERPGSRSAQFIPSAPSSAPAVLHRTSTSSSGILPPACGVLKKRHASASTLRLPVAASSAPALDPVEDSKDLRPGSSPLILSGIATATKSANLHQNEVEALIDRNRHMDSTSIGDTDFQEFTVLGPSLSTVSFEDELKEFEGRIADGWKSLRMEQLHDSNDYMDEDRRRTVEVRKRYDQERKFRQSIKDAQSPKRRVAYKVERQRLTEDSVDRGETSPIHRPIPMLIHKAAGGTSKHDIPLVDVRMLQLRSFGLGSCHNFKALYEHAVEMEKTRIWNAHSHNQAKVNYIELNREPSGKPIMSRRELMRADTIEMKKRDFDARHMRAALCRMATADKNKLRTSSRLSPKSKDDGSSADGSPGPRELSIASLDGGDSISDTASIHSPMGRAISMKRTAATPSTASMTPAMLRRTRMGRGGEGAQGKTSGASFRPDSPTSDRTTLRPSEDVVTAEAQAIKRWGVVRSVLAALWLLQLVRRQHSAGELVRDVLMDHFYLKYVKSTVKNMNARIRKLQVFCKHFLDRKRLWCEQHAKVWAHYEELHLCRYFKALAEEHEHEMRKQAAVASKGFGQSRSGSSKALRIQVEEILNRWKDFRIPHQHRRFALGRWYILAMKKKARNKHKWIMVIDRATESSKDLNQFYTLCGHRPSPANGAFFSEKEDGKVAKPTNIRGDMHFGEQEALELIAVCAQELRNTHPFSEHPANKDQPAKEISVIGRYKRIGTIQDLEARDSSRSRDQWLGRLRKTRVHEGSQLKKDSQVAGEGGGTSVDMDDVLRRFT